MEKDECEDCAMRDICLGSYCINICCYEANSLNIEQTGEAATDNFIEILQELIKTDPAELWAEHGDEPI